MTFAILIKNNKKNKADINTNLLHSLQLWLASED